MKTRLVGSAPTLDDLNGLIKKKWFWNDVHFIEVKKDKEWQVWVSMTEVEDLRVTRKKKRFRLEKKIWIST